jgi:prolyl oligopeptidase
MRPWLVLVLLAGANGAVPLTPKRPVVDVYHGTKVVDDYRWLENGKDPEVVQWSDAQNAHARAVLDALPSRKAIEKRVTALMSWESPAHYSPTEAGGAIFALKEQPPRQQLMLVAFASASDFAQARTVLDPTAVDPSGHTSIDWYIPSHDGHRVAISLSKGGSEEGDVHVYDAGTGAELSGDLIPHAQSGTAGGSVAWNGEGTGFFYTRYPRDERPPPDRAFYEQVWFHKIGTPTASDQYEIGKDFPRIAEIALKTSEDGRYALAIVELGDGGQYMHWLRGPDGAWKQLTRYEDGATAAHFGLDDAVYLLSKKDAPRGKLIRIPLADPSLARATVVVPEGPAVIQSFVPTRTRLYLTELLGGPSRLRKVDLSGKDLGLVDTLPISHVRALTRLGQSDDILFLNMSHVVPLAWFRLDGADGRVTRTALAETSPWDFSGVEVVREEAVSKDGTRVPVTILRPKGVALDGARPTVLTGYGGYGVAQIPFFSADRAAWLEQGGVVALANLRGGGEFGESWHQAGALTHKQNVFDDFYACARLLVDKGYTRPERLAIRGASNGGLLMGAALTQHPDVFKAVVSHVGIYDMVRVETTPNGEFNVTEFGTVKDPAQFQALFAYSPYHHVRDGTQYPAILFLTGANDPRVDPYHSRKMTARLQAAGTRQPVLLRTSSGSGHGFGTARSEWIAQTVDVYAFLFSQLGVKYQEVP